MYETDIVHIRLVSQLLMQSQMQTPHDIVVHMGAIQAQDYNMAKWAVGIRLPNSIDKQVEEAINNGSIIRTHVMRPTWHFVSPHNIHWMLELTAPRIITSVRTRDKVLELTEEVYTKANTIIEKALSKGAHLTRSELVTHLTKAKIAVDNYRIGHIMLCAELNKIVCSGTLQGKEQTYALFANRVPAGKALHKDEALAKLASMYFTSHSPATLKDFVWWSGLTIGEARKGIDAISSNLITEKIDDKTYYIANQYATCKISGKPVHLLPAFDEFLISYTDRKAAIHTLHHSKAISSNGIFRPTIAVNGQIIGIWRKTIKKNKVEIETNYFETPTDSIIKSVEKQFGAYEQFLNIADK